VKGTLELFSDDLPATAEMGPEMRTVGVEGMNLSLVVSIDHEVTSPRVDGGHLAAFEVARESDAVPAIGEGRKGSALVDSHLVAARADFPGSLFGIPRRRRFGLQAALRVSSRMTRRKDEHCLAISCVISLYRL
jgi:hypothetical protein